MFRPPACVTGKVFPAGIFRAREGFYFSETAWRKIYDPVARTRVRMCIAIRDPNQTSLKAVFFAYFCKFSLVVRQVQHRSPLQQSAKKYGFKVLRILTAINLEKSRQTNEVILGVLQESLTPILQILRR